MDLTIETLDQMDAPLASEIGVGLVALTFGVFVIVT